MRGLEMYFDNEISKEFAQSEQNEKNYNVAEIIDRIIMEEIKGFTLPVFIAELGGGAHSDRYHALFDLLLKEPKSRIDWVDISPKMINLAKYYLKGFDERFNVINFVQSDIIDYLKNLKDNQLDVANMKYTFEFLNNDIDYFFFLLSKKLKINGRFISTISHDNDEVKTITTNTKFFVNGKDLGDTKVKLKDGDWIRLKFFKETGNPLGGFIKGAETIIYYHSFKKIIDTAKKYNLKAYIQNGNDFLPQDKKMENVKQTILVIRK